jgi:hypothetical protein
VRKNSVIPDSRQIQLFSDIEDNQPVQPLPLQIASDYNFPLQYHQTPDDVIVYSIQDWIAGVGQAAEPRDFWAKLKKRLKTVNPQLWTSCLQLPYIASNGKSYKMDFADDVTLYRITQQMSTNTGIRNEVPSSSASPESGP